MKRWAPVIWVSLFAIPLAFLWIARMYAYIYRSDVIQSWYGILDGWFRCVGVPWFVVIVTIGAGYIVGNWLLGRLRIGININLILATAIGLSVITWVTYLFGLAGWLRWYWFVLMGMMIYIWGWRSLWTDWGTIWAGLRSILSWHWTEKVLFAVIAWYICKTLPAVTNPATGWDECNSHLVLPRLYVETGRIEFYEWVNFSNFPPFLHMLLTIQQMFTSTPGAVWSYVFHLGTLVVIWMLVRDVVYIWFVPGRTMWYTRISAFLSILLYLMLPLTTLHSQAVLTDPVLVFYCSLLLWATLIILRDGYQLRVSYMYVVGMLVGIVISIKYTGIIWVGLITIFILWLFYRRFLNRDIFNAYVPEGKWWNILPMFFVAIILYCAPWMIRNIILFGDPIFPTLHLPLEWGTVPADVQVQLSINYSSMLKYFSVWHLNVWNWLGLVDTAPWTGVNPRPDEVGPVLICGVPLIAFIWKDMNHAGKIAILVGLAYIATWIFGLQILHTRYMMVAYPVLCCGVGVAITKLMEERNESIDTM